MSKNLKWIWLYKYSDDLANFWGGILVLCFGLLIFLGITMLDNLSDLNVIISFAVIIFVGIMSYFLMLYFAYKVPVITDYNKSERHRNKMFIITESRIETLKVAGIGDDLIKCLSDLLDEKNELIMSIIPESEENWLKDLTDKLGETRIADYEDTLLKYTFYKKIPESNT